MREKELEDRLWSGLEGGYIYSLFVSFSFSIFS